jgi:hypothetical protein
MNAAVDFHDLARVQAAGDWSFDGGLVVLSRSMDTNPVYLHNFIMGVECVHIDGDGLNNCRANLRVTEKPVKKARKSRRKAIAHEE